MTNTVKIGDLYEDKCFEIITKALSDEELCFPSNYSIITQKSKHYSRDRKKDIVFDISIEVIPKGSAECQLLGIIECKSYTNKKVPVDDVEEFFIKVQQVSGLNVRGIMITNSGFSSGAIEFAKSKKIMLLNTEDDDYSIILHRSKRFQINELDPDIEIENFLLRAFYSPKIEGLEKLSGVDIENYTKNILLQYSLQYSKLNAVNMIEYLAKEKGLKVDLNADLLGEYGPETEGVFDIKNKIIKIDKSISDTPKMKFILGHEIGHFYLHNSLKINHRLYSTFQDSTYSTLEKKYELATDKDWIEWQANKFSSSLFLQKNIFMNELIRFRRDILGITTPETIFLDDQKCNQSDYFRTVNHLCTYFETTKLAIDYKLNELGIITRNEKVRGLFDSL